MLQTNRTITGVKCIYFPDLRSSAEPQALVSVLDLDNVAFCQTRKSAQRLPLTRGNQQR